MLDRQTQRLHAAFTFRFPVARSILVNMARPQAEWAVIPVVNTGERAVSTYKGSALLALEVLFIHENAPFLLFLTTNAIFLTRTLPVSMFFKVFVKVIPASV